VQGSDGCSHKTKVIGFPCGAGEICRHCGTVNLFPGFSQMVAFTCRECGKANMA
jgi:uncharacterized protein (DUF983 family)